MSTLTIRNVPDEVAAVLAEQAQMARQSINTTVIQVLQRGIGGIALPRKKRNLSPFCGSWQKEDVRDFQAATQDTRKINPEDWK